MGLLVVLVVFVVVAVVAVWVRLILLINMEGWFRQVALEDGRTASLDNFSVL